MSVFTNPAHGADPEVVWSYRLRKVLAEDRPELTGYDQDWRLYAGHDLVHRNQIDRILNRGAGS